ncbi:hypothetical protein V6N13_086368 [Hibiscus sabdariffa]|uniref:Uncharacterized protein n=1 Tax=Hibiscus sabdariffa TaxID=183260 RepID=A0ABR2FT24_9ROSI
MLGRGGESRSGEQHSSEKFWLAKRRQARHVVDDWFRLDNSGHRGGFGVGTTYDGGDSRGRWLHHKPALQRRASATTTTTGDTSGRGEPFRQNSNRRQLVWRQQQRRR